jgi:hypothetical protein
MTRRKRQAPKLSTALNKANGRKSKAKGGAGERNARSWLIENGWDIADSETSGLAGDDFFACSPEGNWYSIEVKNTNSWYPRYVLQAKQQASKRFTAIREILEKGEGRPYELALLDKLQHFESNDWLVMWHPSNSNARGNAWVFVYDVGGYSFFSDGEPK